MPAPHLPRVTTQCAGSRARGRPQLALDYFRNREQLVVELKGPTDYVTHADRDVEDVDPPRARGGVSRRHVPRRGNGRAVRADRSIAAGSSTRSTARTISCAASPYWNVSIGFVADGRTQVGVVYDPPADALYHAQSRRRRVVPDGRSASRAGPRGAHDAALAGSYMVLGHHDRAFEPRYFEIRRRMMEAGIAMRNFGSGALQLAHVASGRLDGFIELQLSCVGRGRAPAAGRGGGRLSCAVRAADADREGDVRRVRAGHRRRVDGAGRPTLMCSLSPLAGRGSG